MSETSETRKTVAAYYESLEARAWDRVESLLAEDVVYEMPQSRERIRGRAKYMQFNQGYPGDWHLYPRRIVADGSNAAAWVDARVGDEPQVACVWLELNEDSRIARIVDYWPEPSEPMPGREHLVERW